MEPKELLQAALDKAGGSAKLARAINVGNSTITRWKQGRSISGAHIAALAQYVATEKSENQQMPNNGLKYLQDTLLAFTNTNLSFIRSMRNTTSNMGFLNLVSCIASLGTLVFVAWKLG